MSQPDAPLTAADLDIAAQATVYTGDPIVHREDTDGDGRIDRIEVDYDADGDAVRDGVEEDLDGDEVADRFGLGLGPDHPFGEPELWVDDLPEPRDGMTSDDAAGFPPLRGPDDLDVPAEAVADPGSADPGFGSGADERETDYAQEAVNTFADTLQAAPAPERLDAMVDTGPYEAPAEPSAV